MDGAPRRHGPATRVGWPRNQCTEEAPGNTASVIDTANRRVVVEIATRTGAYGISASGSGDWVFIAGTFADTVSVIDPAHRQVSRSTPVGAGPGGIAFATA